MNRRIPLHAALACLAMTLATGCTPQAPADPAADAAASPATPPAETRSSTVPAAGDEAADDAADPALDSARAAAMAFSGRLRARLQGAMAEGGPVAAVEVCHDDAPRIAEAVMAEHGLRLGRVAVPGRNRNPAHAPDDWRLATLEVFQAAVDGGAPAGEQIAVLRDGLPDGVALRMMRGIATEPGCLACHGGKATPEVREAIAARYPGDRATGFAVGDLRGALWVEVPAAAAAAAPQ